MLDFIIPGDHERVITDLKNAVNGQPSTGQEYQLTRLDGSTFPALVYGGKIADPETGKPVGVRGVIIDITDRKKQAQDLYENKERLELALNAGDIGIWDVDMRTMQVKDIYEWANRTLGCHLEDSQAISINTCKTLLHPLDLPKVLFAFFQHLKGNKPLFETEFRAPCSDGSWKWIAIRGKVIERDSRNQPVRITGTVNAITKPVE
jgi:PAS domain-containing protein